MKAGAFESAVWCTSGPGGSSSVKANRQLHYAGSGAEQVPIELVTCPNFRPSRIGPVRALHRTTVHKDTSTSGKAFGVSKGGAHAGAGVLPAIVAKSNSPTTASPRGDASHAPSHKISHKMFRQKEPLILTNELRTDVKAQLDNLAAHCRTEEAWKVPHVSTARTLVVFLKCMQNICDLVGAPISEKAYRSAYSFEMLNALISLWDPQIAEIFAVELSGCGGKLPSLGYLAFTVLVALMEVPWNFTYNTLTHTICSCKNVFPGTTRCLVPAGGPPGETLDGRLVASLASTFAARAPGSPVNVRSLYARIDQFRRRERHFPAELIEITAAVRDQFLNFLRAVPYLIEDFDNLPLTSSILLSQGWERFVGHFTSEVNVFDRVYTRFERLYLDLADRMIGIALEPVKGMTEPSSSLVCKPGDPFKPFETAVLCQRLGLLNQQVNFGGPHHLVHFDPHLLGKAQRVMMMSTYAEVRSMAQAMLSKFDSLCTVLVKLTDAEIQPELQDNRELREAVVSLEAIWAECQFVLQQDVLDFIQLFLDYTPSLGSTFRSQLFLAMHDDDVVHVQSDSSTFLTQDVTTSSAEDAQQNARQILFETLPILMYLDELWRDIKVQRGEATKEMGPLPACAFRELFCRKSERHHMLRRDFAKFDEQRFARFRSFLLGEQEDDAEGGHLQSKYFQNVYRQLKEVAAFPTGESPSEAMRVATRLQTQVCMEPSQTSEDDVDVGRFILQESKHAAEARARWICVQRVAQTVEPQLFDCSHAAHPSKQGALDDNLGHVRLTVEEARVEMSGVTSPAGASNASHLQDGTADEENSPGHERSGAGSPIAGSSPQPPQGAPPDGRKPRARQSLRTSNQKKP